MSSFKRINQISELSRLVKASSCAAGVPRPGPAPGCRARPRARPTQDPSLTGRLLRLLGPRARSPRPGRSGPYPIPSLRLRLPRCSGQSVSHWQPGSLRVRVHHDARCLAESPVPAHVVPVTSSSSRFRPGSVGGPGPIIRVRPPACPGSPGPALLASSCVPASADAVVWSDLQSSHLLTTVPTQSCGPSWIPTPRRRRAAAAAAASGEGRAAAAAVKVGRLRRQ